VSHSSPVRGSKAILFLDSGQLGEQYRNDVFVGDINNGTLYHFEPNGTRDGFNFGGAGLDDLVADNDSELQELIFGTGFGGITDLKVGPDGLLYVLSLFQGKIFSIGREPVLVNVSARGLVGIGDDIQIGGFIIGGTEDMTVLIRARGPTLADFGVPGELTNPFLQLFSGQTVIAENDNWETTLPLCQNGGFNCGGAAEITATGMDPCVGNLTGCTSESSILITLAPGPYTAIVSGVGGGTGVGLVEVFEVDTASTSTLTNISSRGLVGIGDDVMIGGFIIGGTDSKTVLVRARGPVLTDFGVPGELSDPVLQLFSGQTVIARNDDWQSTDPLCGAPAVSCGGQAEIVATGLDPCVGNLTGCTNESAVLITLPPGPYTVIVSGVGGGTGVGMFEVFEVNGTP